MEEKTMMSKIFSTFSVAMTYAIKEAPAYGDLGVYEIAGQFQVSDFDTRDSKLYAIILQNGKLFKIQN